MAKKVEVFSAGCSVCKETIEMVKRLAGSQRSSNSRHEQVGSREEGEELRSRQPTCCCD